MQAGGVSEVKVGADGLLRKADGRRKNDPVNTAESN